MLRCCKEQASQFRVLSWYILTTLQQIECSLLNAGHHFSFQHWVNDQLPVCELSAAAAPESPRRLAATGDWRGQSVGDTRWLCDGGMLAWCGSWCRAGACCHCTRCCREVGGGGGAWRGDPGPVPQQRGVCTRKHAVLQHSATRSTLNSDLDICTIIWYTKWLVTVEWNMDMQQWEVSACDLLQTRHLSPARP